MMFSRQVKKVEYDSAKKYLTIEFSLGIEKTYSNVPEEIYQDLSKAPDQTSFYEEKINCRYPLKPFNLP